MSLDNGECLMSMLNMVVSGIPFTGSHLALGTFTFCWYISEKKTF